MLTITLLPYCHAAVWSSTVTANDSPPPSHTHTTRCAPPSSTHSRIVGVQILAEFVVNRQVEVFEVDNCCGPALRGLAVSG